MGRKVLLVDDDPIANMINNELFKVSGYKVVAYTSPKKALEFLNTITASSEFIPEIIMLDINMPEMDGWEFLEAYQKTSFALDSDCRLYILTSSIAPEDQDRATTCPSVSGFISKPLTMEWIEKL
ncbi:response regulator [Fulvivirga kasyanovii]|uniref:Response regulator n=1 Tax=Fulvivirga kasyanovii TaxID=396812 RepID=A0ABW9RTC5_9BACT|nr:response regulator [Fulvivirga kasyanovii]MTI27141.1 response regulator [Fulvivirga kasyanovii]